MTKKSLLLFSLYCKSVVIYKLGPDYQVNVWNNLIPQAACLRLNSDVMNRMDFWMEIGKVLELLLYG